MENIYVKALKAKGFGLIEVIIALAVVAVLGGVGYASYQDHLVKATENTTKKEMIALMTNYEKFYSQNGSYTKDNGKLPDTIEQVINDNNDLDHANYTYITYPRGAITFSQVACIEASANKKVFGGRLQNIVVDNFGHVTVGDDIPNVCSGGEAKPAPTPDDSEESKPTPTPTPECDPKTEICKEDPNPYPSGECRAAFAQFELSQPGKYHWAFTKDFDGGQCQVNNEGTPKSVAGVSGKACNNQASNSWVGDCTKGRCNGVRIFDGSCNGGANCNSLLICSHSGIACDGNCDGNGDIWLGGKGPSLACRGGCTSINIHYPSRWEKDSSADAIKNTICGGVTQCVARASSY